MVAVLVSLDVSMYVLSCQVLTYGLDWTRMNFQDLTSSDSCGTTPTPGYGAPNSLGMEITSRRHDHMLPYQLVPTFWIASKQKKKKKKKETGNWPGTCSPPLECFHGITPVFPLPVKFCKSWRALSRFSPIVFIINISSCFENSAFISVWSFFVEKKKRILEDYLRNGWFPSSCWVMGLSQWWAVVTWLQWITWLVEWSLQLLYLLSCFSVRLSA